MGEAILSRRGLLALGAAGAILAPAARAAAATGTRAVTIPSGGPVLPEIVQGRDMAVDVYRGIPYAAPPVGDLRFAPPGPVKPWTTPRQPVFGPAAIQQPSPSSVNPTSELGRALQQVFPVRKDVESQSEDCLYLNIWTRHEAKYDTPRPVMVWLHGGGFDYGSGSWPSYDGTHLVEQGVVVVTLNHRLNVFGYLDLPEVEGSGNAGMLDIVQALRWIQQNIHLFGGDHCNVTIFGESGGGAKVSYLLAMKKARGLFHRAIIQSGPGVKALPPERAAALRKDLYAELGVTPGDVKALRALPYDRLLQASAAAEAKQPGAGFDRAGFSPVADDDILPRHPWDPAGPAVSWDVPVIIGLNKDEMTLFMASQPWFGKMDNAGLEAMAAGIYGPRAPQVLAALRKDFPKDSPTYLATHLVTYGRMFAGSVQIAERKAAQKGGNIWFYLLEWETPVGPFRSPHTLEIPLVFDNVDTARVLLGPGPEPQLMARQMSKAWVWFARYGDPNSGDLPKWPTYDAAKRSTMIFNTTCRVVDDPYSATRKAVT